MTLGDIIGSIGVGCFLTAYFYLQKGTWKPHSAIYLSANLAGAVLVMISLVMDWNLPAFLLEAAWALISIWGLSKIYAKPHTDD
jgi:paired small multidrug resistance pump